ncbi:hypothetical protein [Shewanella sp. OMA3-2]|uniref:hypothetical protein n=1 Tax=Shewanella sp. OMA3-2 TaxID=2908650 RepID=UPI001F3255B2|nr:hypothetical protein [Shewanella sp. OMA3-2]UJF22563.1 hypothetical protein L0B17_03905 [Shewanella sp. OMA3-2]
MTDYQTFFIQAYWWLSLLGGIHCLGVALFIRYSYQGQATENKSLAGIVGLVGFYFLTGLLTQEFSPIPIHLLLSLCYPVYFLLMPLLYIYSKQSLHGNNYQANFFKHFMAAMLAAILICSAIFFGIGINLQASNNTINSLAELSHINALALILPSLILIQAVFYFTLIYQLLMQAKINNEPLLSSMRLRWITILAIGMLINWLVRFTIVYFPFYSDGMVSIFPQAITRLSLLVTVYILAFYGLHQVTRAAYLSGRTIPRSSNSLNSQQILDADELSYLQDVIADDDADKHKDSTT